MHYQLFAAGKPVKVYQDPSRPYDIKTYGGEIYKQMLPYCNLAHVTKIDYAYQADTYFPNLDADHQWELTQVLQAGEENGIAYEMCLYQRKGTD